MSWVVGGRLGAAAPCAPVGANGATLPPMGQLPRWSYDKTGNRLTETRAGLTDSYLYELNGSGGRTALLDKINVGSGGVKDYLFDEAGNLAQVAAAGNTVTFSTDAAGRLARIARPAAGVSTDLLYDGRDYLAATSGEAPARASSAVKTETPAGVPGVLIFADGFETGNTCGWSQTVGGVGLPSCGTPTLTSAVPTYSSDGRLMHLGRSGQPEQIFYFYFYGRPIAQMERSGSDTVRRIVTDHLGTPILMAELGIGGVAWQGGFEPFGRDWREGTSGSATAKNLLLRLPGQWEEESWKEAAEGVGVYYNLHRWIEPALGRYLARDDLQSLESSDLFSYVRSRPANLVDTHGRRPVRPQTFDDPVPEPRCSNCKPHEPEIARALGRVCYNINNNHCQNVLREYGLLPCFQRKCRAPLPVVCVPPGPGDCGGCGGPCNNLSDTTSQIFLQPSAFGGPCGTLSDTVAHEMGHMCGIGADRHVLNARRNQTRAERVGKACGQ